MSGIAFPYFTIPTSAVTASPWFMELNGKAGQAIEGRIVGWDYASGLFLTRAVSVDLDSAAKALGIERAKIKLDVVVSLGSGTARGERQRRIVSRSVLSGEISSVNPVIQVEGEGLSQSIRLVTDVVLISEEGARSPLSPRHKGSRLWQDNSLIYIEPESAQFPIEAVSFSKVFKDYPHGALFHLAINGGDYDQEFRSGVRLLINADDLSFCEKVSAGDEIVLRLLLCAIVIQMVRSALDNETFTLDNSGASESSVRGVVRNWIRQAFPDQSLETVRAIAHHAPAMFETALSTLSADPLQ